ncbi:Uncharacterised protein [Halioglobus japonicus]|nr:Uncharacterised protein [Halioglobus japonicus]
MRIQMFGPLAVILLASVLLGCSDNNNDDDSSAVPNLELANNVLVLTDQAIPNFYVQQALNDGESDPAARLNGDIMGRAITIVKLRGKASHVGVDITQSPPEYIAYHVTVPDTRIWIAEYRETRDLDLRTDETGWWTLYVVKDTGVDLAFSFVFEKDGWATTKTNINTINDEDNTDFGIQLIDGDYYHFSMVPFIEAIMRGSGYPNFFFESALVATIGKSWGSLHDDRLPHGDPGAVATISPGPSNYIGPVYFNEDVIPDLAQPDVSVDGGVAWLNLSRGKIYSVSAEKEGVNYPTIRFNVTEADAEYGVTLYIASPPDSVEGDNDSAPGEP